MIINATAYYHEEENAELTSRLKASLQVYSDTPKSDDYARAMARAIYQNMIQAMPCGKGGKTLCG